ncbi:hypothetical protein [Comamonas sp. F1-6]|uniref:hypothetical protein n=1 Tax=Comamonas sp. F1-6 TaxID=673550 RepID=UPI0031E0FE70
MQRAIDRAYLIESYGQVWKHARLTNEQYKDTEFIAEYPREGGIILDAVKEGANAIVDRIAAAIHPVFEEASNRAVIQSNSLARQISARKEYIQGVGARTQSFQDVIDNPPPNWASAYSNRSVIKEVDQLVKQITPEDLAGSTAEITINGEVAHLPYFFTAQTARRFHAISSKRELGAPLILKAKIRSLDRGNKTTKPSAKIENLHTNRDVILHLRSIEDFNELRPFHNGEPIQIYVCPIVEALGFDVNGGDLYYLAVA